MSSDEEFYWARIVMGFPKNIISYKKGDPSIGIWYKLNETIGQFERLPEQAASTTKTIVEHALNYPDIYHPLSKEEFLKVIINGNYRPKTTN